MSGPGEWTPTNDRQHPPFEPGNPWRFEPGHDRGAQPGNKLALTHGADSKELVAQDAQVIVERVLADPALAYLHDPTFMPVLARYARLRARADRFARALDEHTATGCMHCEKCESWDERWQKAETTAGRAAEKLGLDPLSRARLMSLMAQTRAQSQQMDEANAVADRLIEAIVTVQPGEAS